ncbi:F-box protein SKIP19-like isoform X2 [Actinidia eriantha]|uniref:F-box protein SKIP19-like isoform X2 n=1 Tax=Actinidia eriantha TaxID=165200 RepID=UPI00258C7A1A|nr:F-box protein SKIP19-like isoform X2 [Actinidia eriantha]
MASSSSSQQLQAADETRNWLELPRDVTATILHKLGAIEILESAQKVCTTWRSICKDPAMWRTIDMYDPGDLPNKAYDLEKMAMHAIDRSCGELVDIKVEYFGTDELLQYIAERFGWMDFSVVVVLGSSGYSGRWMLMAEKEMREKGFGGEGRGGGVGWMASV